VGYDQPVFCRCRGRNIVAKRNNARRRDETRMLKGEDPGPKGVSGPIQRRKRKKNLINIIKEGETTKGIGNSNQCIMVQRQGQFMTL